MDSPDISDLRRSYERGQLDLEDLNSNPFLQFRDWFELARATPEVIEPNAMALSTVDAEGQPNSRAVLLKAYDNKGFVFFTNYGSNKALEIEANRRVALLFNWLGLERQLKILGHAERISRTDSVKYFLSRPAGSQLGAWVSDQSRVISGRGLLMSKLDEMKRKFADGKVPCPDFWGGYRIEPHQFEFWQGGRDRLHDRFRYSSTADGEWQIERLSP
ncbi:MAG: pyridoxamine 5'-phosphate oxidase [Verrucomicrobiales bacterium]|nr:pyridoxamine 5'-phosphate oxidase [Verrucomicrobiales bacterium]|tara:strand:+ start:247 stop:897 length:651 start_codon:yes stop_codon:yes gene_type:complete